MCIRDRADAARSRSEADWLVGINGTRAMTAFNSRDGGFFLTTVGRVQTPTLSIVVEREEKIRKHVSRPYWEVKASFDAAAGVYDGKWFDPAWKKNPDDPEASADRLWNAAHAQAIAAAARGQGATGADEAYVQNTELGELHKYIDFLNIMTYDFYNGWHNVNGHHSNYLPSAKPEMDKNSVVNAVDMHLNAGFPVEKINLGIPFYGRIWKGVKTDSDQILINKAETGGMGIDYIDFYKNINANGFTRYWDDTAKAPYLWNPEEKTFISYEDEESIKIKIDYLKNRGLAGVMFWEYSGDHDKTLLDAVVEDLR